MLGFSSVMCTAIKVLGWNLKRFKGNRLAQGEATQIEGRDIHFRPY
jgi:hypothetical protein